MKKTLTVVTLLAAGASQAAGFAIDTQSARATGMGSTGVASTQDASGIYYNPAGILGVKALDLQLGDSLIPVHLGFTPDGGTEQTQNTLSPPPHLYFAYKVTDKFVAGVGVYTPFGANIHWPDDFVGRQLDKESRLATYDITPTVGFAPLDWLRIGVGAQLLYGTVDIRRALNFGTSEGSAQFAGNGWGFGYTAGVQADVVPGLLTLGAQYRSEVKTRFKGDATFRDIPAPFAAAVPPNQPIRADVRLPSSVGLGLAFVPYRRLLIAFDANWVQWSSFQELAVEFQTTPSANQPEPKNWRSTWNFHVGAEYGVTDAFKVRLGYAFDPTPSPTTTLAPDLPDADRMNYTVGVGYDLAPFRADLGYQLVTLRKQRSDLPQLPGTYQGTAHVVGLTLGYSR